MNRQVDILFACDINESRPWFRDRVPSIKKAMESVSHTVELIDIYGLLGEHENMPTNVSQRIAFLQDADLLEANKNFENGVAFYNPKVLILGTADNYHQFLLPETIRRIRSKGIYVAGILGDDEFNYPIYRFLLGWFDLFIAYVKPCIDYYENFGLSKGYFFPNSCYLNNKNFDDHNQATEYDAILVGAPIANRADMVKALIDSGVNVAIYGSKKWENYDFAKKHYYGYVSTKDFDNVLSKGKIVLAFLEDHLSGKLHMNTKIWEAVRVARLPISTYYEPLEKDYGLTEGVDLATYASTEELVSKVIYYANNDFERCKIVESLYNKVKNEFDYSVMYKNLFDKLISLDHEENKNNKDVNEFIEDNKFGYLKKSSSHLDEEVVNIFSVISKIDSESYDYIYFNSIEKGKRVVVRWPLINFQNIIFKKEQKTRFGYFVIFVKAFLLRKTIHVSQFCLVSKEETLVGRINRVIDKCTNKMMHTTIGFLLRKYIKKVYM